jgi:23S rRNA (guanine2445-N2)-methyltransferase / 23S rRNA (guanine2069-N7)-methyltransferase
VQEYQAPLEIEEELTRVRLGEALGAVAQVLELPEQRLVLKQRRRQRGGDQYTKLDNSGRLHPVEEAGCRLLVNFRDYLDTGLFLDHRLTRALVRNLAPGRDFLNLFAYTGAATVQAAAGGARTTTSLDLSNTYLDWAEENLVLNRFGGAAHRLIQADCMAWLREQAEARTPERRYGLIFLDPPTFSTSKRMEETLDIQRDHGDLIRWAAQLLTPDGILLFSTNYRRFRLDNDSLAGLEVEDIGQATIPEDFRRNPRIHRCWRISRRP